VSYRNAAPRTVIELAKGAGLRGIEWSADTHAPHGDVKRAEELMMATLRAGLTMPSYGSFYRLGRTDCRPRRFPSGAGDSLPACRPPPSASGHPSKAAYRAWRVAGEGRKIAGSGGEARNHICLEPHERSAVSGYGPSPKAARLATTPFSRSVGRRCPPAGRRAPESRLKSSVPARIDHVRNWTASCDPNGRSPRFRCLLGRPLGRYAGN
jgi:hypothetical protein